MAHKKPDRSEITPESLYLSRRSFIAAGGAVLAATAVTAACRGVPSGGAPSGFCAGATATVTKDELGANLTSCEDVTNYNNFYEFSLDKGGIGDLGKSFPTSPWTVAVGGLVASPLSLSMDQILAKYPQQERVYRLRCVEAWSMVIPWIGFPLASLLKDAQPLPAAKYVRFEAVLDLKDMPGQRAGFLDFPYIEGLRLDEAMNDLTILATGLYGKPLPVQDGAPIRLIVPWKYGFKSIKSIVKIDLVEQMPVSSWMEASPDEYGFYSNVNPDVPHPRWSQSTERRIGEFARRATILFNGYGNQVASLYAGMDLKKNF
jgi:sulfoxide reductase catalytic subunit YedY